MRANLACGQFCKEEIEAVNPATCQTLLLFSLSHGLGKPTVFLSGGGLRIKCENSSLALRFCVAKSNLAVRPVLQGRDRSGESRRLPDFGLIQEIALERKTHWDSGG